MTAKERLERKWKKELRRKDKQKKKMRGFQIGHKGYWLGKKRSDKDKEKIKEGLCENFWWLIGR